MKLTNTLLYLLCIKYKDRIYCDYVVSLVHIFIYIFISFFFLETNYVVMQTHPNTDDPSLEALGVDCAIVTHSFMVLIFCSNVALSFHE